MSTGAKFAIQGFLYQFNKTLLEILNSDDTTVTTMEGIIEDIDQTFDDGSVEAIQCKYHESREAYSPSLIYKPLLQMIEHYVTSGLANVRYQLFVHVSGESPVSRNIDKCAIRRALSSAQSKRISEKMDLACFDEVAFAQVCFLEFGPSLDALRKEVVEAFKCTSLPEDSIATLYYPNAINLIAKRSTHADASSRKITKPRFLEILADIRKTAISRWTLALKTREAILRTRRSQLKPNLSKNSRNRCIIVSQDTIEDFDQGIVLFIQEFLAKYHFKPNHEKPPTFYLECDKNLFMEIRRRLYQKSIRFTTGMEISDTFNGDYFYREPVTRVVNNSHVQSDFQIRIACHSESHDALLHRGFDDVYIVSNTAFEIREQDVEIEPIPLESFSDLQFILGLSDVI